eukprot:16442308-Heterocapsa_arctica.AAC.1
MPRRAGAAVVQKQIEVAVVGADRRRCAIYCRSEARVHFLPRDDEVPLCRRRRGAAGAPIKRSAISGM